jgi:biopolymer transport protein ExbD
MLANADRPGMQLVQFLAVSMSGSNREDAMVIGVRRDGAVYFGAERVRSDEVPSKILNRLKEPGVERKVYISVDRRACSR